MTDAATPRPRRAGGSFDLVRILLEGRAFFALILIIIVFSLLSPNYFSVSNFLTMANHVAIYGLLSIGMLLVILNGGIDLSVGSVLALCGVIAGALMQGVTLDWARGHPLSAGLGRRRHHLRVRRLRRRGQRRPDRLAQGARPSSPPSARSTSPAASRS